MPGFRRVLGQRQTDQSLGWGSIWNCRTKRLDSVLHGCWRWETVLIWVDFGCARGTGFGPGFVSAPDARKGIVFRSTSKCPSLVQSCEEREQLPSEGMSSSWVQQVLMSWEGCNSFLDHKSCSSTTTWRRRGRSTRSSSLLRVYVPPALALYTSTTLALRRTSSQSAADRNKGGTQTSRHL